MSHKEEAIKHIEWAHEQQERDGEFDCSIRDNALIAQTEATLALVEAQETANELKRIEIRVQLADGVPFPPNGTAHVGDVLRPSTNPNPGCGQPEVTWYLDPHIAAALGIGDTHE